MDKLSQSPYYYAPPYQPVAQPPLGEQRESGGRRGAKFSTVLLTAVASSALVFTLMDGFSSAPLRVAAPVISTAEVAALGDAPVSQVLQSVYTVAVQANGTRGSGSGVAIDGEHVVTNAHVVTLANATGAPRVEVQNSSGEEFSATVVGVDPISDVAVLKVKSEEPLVPVAWGESKTLTIGQGVIALGAPLGLSNTVTAGIVSAVDRPVELSGPKTENPDDSGSTFVNTVQTDAAINSGNSGGPLIDGDGRLVGLNVAISAAGESGGNIGIGYAIPVDYVRRVAGELIEEGVASHGLLGVTSSTAASEGGNFSDGAIVVDVVEGSAADGKLRRNDVITRWNGKPVDSTRSLIGFVKSTAPGTKVVLTVKRSLREKTLEVTLGSDLSS